MVRVFWNRVGIPIKLDKKSSLMRSPDTSDVPPKPPEKIWTQGPSDFVMRDRSELITILHVSSTSGPGGAEMIFSHLAASVDRSRFRSIACLFRPGWVKDRCDELGIDTYVLGINGMFDWRWVRDCLNLVRRENVALIHAHEFTANTYGTLVARLAGIPVVATVHGKSYYAEQLKRRLAYRFVSRFAHMIAVSQDLKRHLVESVGIQENRISVIYNGIQVPNPPAPITVANYRRELGLGPKEQVVGVVGSLYPVKGHRYLLEAAPEVIQQCHNTTFLIIGQGGLEVPLKEKVKELGLERHVRFLGLRQDVPMLVALMDIFVLPSLSEGSSIALLEAMAAGRPVVATDVGGNPEIVVDGITGYLVPPQKPDQLAARLLSLLSNKAHAQQLGQNGRKRVREHFSLEQMMNKYQDLYTQCLGVTTRSR